MSIVAEKLREARLLQGKSLKELAQRTRIREQFLLAIEQGRFDVLPGVYVRSFVKTYATALGMPVDEILRLLNQDYPLDRGDPAFVPRTRFPEKNVRQSIARKTPSPSGRFGALASSLLRGLTPNLLAVSIKGFFGNRFRLILFTVLAFLFVVTLALMMFSNSESGRAGLENTALTVAPILGEGAGEPENVAQDSIVLEAVVNDTAWIDIRIDRKHSHQSVLLPGSEHKWKAFTRFELTLSNAGGVQFIRDGIPLPSLGNPGEVVRHVDITRDDVNSSSIAWKSNTVKISSSPEQPQAKTDLNSQTNSTKPTTNTVQPDVQQAKPKVKQPAKPAAPRQAKPTQTMPKAETRPVITPAPIRQP